jgi:hypothetical protein
VLELHASVPVSLAWYPPPPLFSLLWPLPLVFSPPPFSAESRPKIGSSAPRGAPGAEYFVSASDVSFASPVNYPPHERCVEIEVDLGMASADGAPAAGAATILGSDLTHEYVAENAD